MDTMQRRESKCDQLSLDQLRNIRFHGEGVAAELARLADFPQLKAGIKKRGHRPHERHGTAKRFRNTELAGADLLTVLDTMFKTVATATSLPLRE